MSIRLKSSTDGDFGYIQVNGIDVLTTSSSGAIEATTFKGPTGGAAATFIGDGSGLTGIVSGDTTTVTMVTTTATVIDTIAWNSFKALEYTIHITNGSNIQAQKLLVMCDGTASSDHHTEYGVMYSSSLLGTFSTATDGSEVNVKFTATNSFTTTVKFIKQVVV